MTDATNKGEKAAADGTFEVPEERDQTRFRQHYYGLLVRLFSAEPPAALLNVLRSGVAERAEAAEAIHPQLGAGWLHLAGVLPEVTEESAAKEFLRLFIGPFEPELNPYESSYITGQMFQAPLIAVRTFLRQVGLARNEDSYHEPEDVLAFELEVMNWLLTRQLAAGSAEESREWLHRQSAFLKRHLMIWGPQCARDIAAAKSAVLYKGAALLLDGLLAIERRRLQALGIADIETIEQAKRRYGAPRVFQGPVFDPTQAAKTHDAAPSGKKE